jgi:DNA-binding transcriptional regulator YbjK
MKNKTIRLTLLMALMTAVLVVMTACGEKTLQSYFDDHLEDLKAVEESMNTSGGDLMECTFSVKDNTANLVMKFKKNYSEEEIKQLQTSLKSQTDADMEKYTAAVASMEEKSEVKGITYHLEFQNNDGTVIYERDVTK